MTIPQLWMIPIPKLFWSAYAEGPFLRCLDCDCDLESCDFYLVQKCYVGTEPVFELAMCEGCRTSLSVQCSEETNQAVQAFLQEHLGRREREHQELEELEAVYRRCTDECLICSRNRADCNRYTIGGLGHEMDLAVQLTPQSQSPLMICHECEIQMSTLVSKKTRETWDRFVDRNFDSPPGIGLDSPVFM